MKVFEVGLICEFEGGHGVLIADSENFFRDAKTVLNAAIQKEIRFWTIDANDDDFNDYDIQHSNECQAAYGDALSKIAQANSIEDLRAIKIDKTSELVRVSERQIIGGAK